MSALSRDELIFMSQVCEKAERFDDMMEFMKKVTHMEQELSESERELFSMAFKESVSARRRSWRVLCNLEKVEEDKQNRFLNLIRDYRDRVEKELLKYSEEMLSVLETRLIPSATEINHEAHSYYLKLKGDFYRYIAEVSVGDLYTRSCEKAMLSYEEAVTVLGSRTSPANPSRLSIELNKSVMLYEILSQDEKAVLLAKAVFDEGMKDLDNLGEEDMRESSILLKLMKDNITLWTTDPKLFAKEDEKPKKPGTTGDFRSMKDF